MRTPIEEVYKLAEQKMKQLGFSKHSIVHRNLNISGNTLLEIKGYSQYWYLKSSLFGVTVRSDYGLSGNEIPATNEVIIEHTGLIEIRNNTNKALQVEFVQVLPIK